MKGQKKPSKLFLPGLTLVLFLLASEIFMPTVITDQIKKALLANVYSYKDLEIAHRTRPSLPNFFGVVHEFTAEGSDLEMQNFNASKLFLQAERLKFSLWDLLVFGRFSVYESSGRFFMTLSEAELDRYLHRFYIDDQYNDIKLELKENDPRISGLYEGKQFYLDCVFTVEKNSMISLSPQKMVSTNPDTDVIVEKLEKMAAYSLDLGIFGIPLVIDDLDVADGYLHVFGSIGN